MPPAPKWGWQDDYPMVNLSWYDAKRYAQWAGAALPTEAQWEKAARGTDGRIFPWGNDWDASKSSSSLWTDHPGKPSLVGSFPTGASPYGCLDMAGNVYQWCADYYDPYYYHKSPKSNPTGPETGNTRVVRCGIWNHVDYTYCRAANRLSNNAFLRCMFNGFRCVMR